jgi:hypothetical protein
VFGLHGDEVVEESIPILVVVVKTSYSRMLMFDGCEASSTLSRLTWDG